MPDLARWAERETRRLIAEGLDPQDAERTVAWVLKRLPPGADPDVWVSDPDTFAAQEGSVSEGDKGDARADWYAGDHIPPQFKRVLDAKDADASH